jgi:hypothetical protein
VLVFEQTPEVLTVAAPASQPSSSVPSAPQMPFTGFPASVLMLLALFLLGAGGLLVLVARRRGRYDSIGITM